MNRFLQQQGLFTRYTSGLRFDARAKAPFPGLAAIFLVLSAVLPARAQLIITGEQVGPDVVFTVSGSFDPGTPNFTWDFHDQTRLAPNAGEFEAWQADSSVNQFNLNAAVPFGGGEEVNDGIGSGDNFAIIDALYIDDTYVPGTPFNTTLTFVGETFASLGVDVDGGPYVWTITNSGATVTMQFPQFAQPVIDNSALKASLAKKIKKLKKKAKQAKGNGQSAKAKKLQKKAKKLQKKLRVLG